MRCTLEDDVVARFLDGDCDPAREPELDAHLQGCPACRSALARSRHLDAALATNTQVSPPPALVDRLLERAVAAARPLAAARSGARPRALPWLAAAAGFLVGLLVMRGWGLLETPPVPSTAGAATAPPPAGSTPAPHATAESVLAPMLVLPDTLAQPVATGEESAGSKSPRRLAVRQSGRAQPPPPPLAAAPVHRLVERLEGDVAQHAFAAQAWMRAWSWGIQQPRVQPLRHLVAKERIAAGLALLQAGSPAAVSALARALNRRDEVGYALRCAARDNRAFRARLRAAVRDGCADEICTAAVRLGDSELDRRLLARCRRDQACADLVAAACAGAAEGVQRVDFLLDLWALDERAGDDEPVEAHDETTRATLWFSELPPPATVELLHRLANTRSAEVRRRVFLALAARRDPAALEPLLAWIDAPNAHAATLAAYVLSRLEARFAPRLLAAARTSRRPELLFAAVAGQCHVSSRTSLVAAGLAPAEVELVTSGPFHPDQVAAVAALLRGRDFQLRVHP